MNSQSSFRTVVVLGASYAGHRAVHLLVNSLPDGWRVVVIERNTHFNHLYTFPRLAVLPGHEQKAFIPYTKLFKPESCPGDAPPTGVPESVGSHLFIHGNVTELESHRVHFKSLSPGDGLEQSFIDFDYLVYALGSHLPAPINIWSASRPNKYTTPNSSHECLTGYFDDEHAGTKPESSRWLQEAQKRIQSSTSVLVVGAGALGVQFASDIADVYPDKPVTLVHSRDQLLPRFDPWMHNAAVQQLRDLGVTVLLNTRIDLSSIKFPSTTPYVRTPVISSFPSRASSPAFSTPELSASPSPTPPSQSPNMPSFNLPPPLDQIEDSQTVLTMDGTKIKADLVLFCTGQVQNTWYLDALSPKSINHKDGGSAYILPSFQLATKSEPGGPLEPSGHPHIFVIGDAADAFGALKSGNAAWSQAEMACRNLLRLIRGDGEELESYTPPPLGIKVSLGLKHAIHQTRRLTFEHKGPEDCDDSLNVASMWRRRGLSREDMSV